MSGAGRVSVHCSRAEAFDISLALLANCKNRHPATDALSEVSLLTRKPEGSILTAPPGLAARSGAGTRRTAIRVAGRLWRLLRSSRACPTYPLSFSLGLLRLQKQPMGHAGPSARLCQRLLQERTAVPPGRHLGPVLPLMAFRCRATTRPAGTCSPVWAHVGRTRGR